MSPAKKHLCRALLVGGLALGLVAPAGAALESRAAHASGAAQPSAQPCWKVLLNQWYGGKITTIFPLNCYTEAINHLPADIAVYSSAKQDIQAAEVAAAHGKPAPPETTQPPPTTTTAGSTGSKKKGGLIGVIDDLTPGNPQAFPLPLLILGALAILLVLAGGVGMIWQRRHPSEPEQS